MNWEIFVQQPSNQNILSFAPNVHYYFVLTKLGINSDQPLMFSNPKLTSCWLHKKFYSVSMIEDF